MIPRFAPLLLAGIVALATAATFAGSAVAQAPDKAGTSVTGGPRAGAGAG